MSERLRGNPRTFTSKDGHMMPIKAMDHDLASARLSASIAVPCVGIGSYQRAVWGTDEIWIIRRVGARYLCLVIYGTEGYRRAFMTWLPKRWLRRSLHANNA